ncbi:hypothetical protein HispidOSU_001601 [Sigmodon hispidus]
MGSHAAISQERRPRPAPQPDPGFRTPVRGQPPPRSCSPARPRPRRSATPRPPRPPAAACLPPRLPRPAAPLTRAGPVWRPRDGAEREELDRTNREGRDGPAPPGASATRRGGIEQNREHNSSRLAHPPQRAPAAPEPRAGPSLVPAHAAPHSQLPARARPSPSCRGLAPPLPRARALPVVLANGSSPLLHKPWGRGLGREVRGRGLPPSFPRALMARPAVSVRDLGPSSGCSRSLVTRSIACSPGLAQPSSCFPGRLGAGGRGRGSA